MIKRLVELVPPGRGQADPFAGCRSEAGVIELVGQRPRLRAQRESVLELAPQQPAIGQIEQPEAFPATVAVLAVDLDPLAGQRIGEVVVVRTTPFQSLACMERVRTRERRLGGGLPGPVAPAR